MKLEKITKQRSYDDSCGTAHALELIGERWALLVVRELVLGPRRFGDLRASMPGLSANVLTQRLEGLEKSGLLVRRKLPPPASVQVYELTEWGREAEPIILALGRWAVRSPSHDPDLPLSAVSAMLSFGAMFDKASAGDLAVTLAVRFGQEMFSVVVGEGKLSAARGAPERPDFEISGTPSTVVDVVYGLTPLEEALAKGLVTLTGDREALRRFSRAFKFPTKAG